MKTFYFTTVVSKDYIYKFLALNESLRRCCKSYHLFALCADHKSHKILKALDLEKVTIIPVSCLEKDDLLTAKSNRSFLEYCWTLKPYFLDYIMNKWKEAKYYAHLDADLYFYSNLEEIIEEEPQSSIILTDHNNSENFLHTYRTSGRYNTGFVCCKNNNTGRAAVAWWKERCLENCSAVADVENRRFGDQRYVETWPEQFEGVHVVRTKGANVAQWSIQAYGVGKKNDTVYVNEDKLVFYHFSGFHILGDKLFSISYFYRVEDDALKHIYMPYIQNLEKQIKMLKAKAPWFSGGFAERAFAPHIHHIDLTETVVDQEGVHLGGI